MPHQRANGRQRRKKQCNLKVVDNAVTHCRLRERGTQGAGLCQARKAIAQGAAGADRKTHSRGLHRAPGAERKAAIGSLRQGHGRSERADREEAPADANQHRSHAEEPGHREGPGKDHQREGKDPENGAKGG